MDIPHRTKAVIGAATGLVVASLAVGGFALARGSAEPAADPALRASQEARISSGTPVGPGVEDLRDWQPRGESQVDPPPAVPEQQAAPAEGVIEEEGEGWDAGSWLGDDEHEDEDDGDDGYEHEHEDDGDDEYEHEDDDDEHGEDD